MSLKRRLYIVIFGTDTPAGKWFDIILLWAILISLVEIMLESVKEISAYAGVFFDYLEWFLTILFTLEYLVRLWVSPKPKQYAFSFFGIVDFLALLPTYLSLVLTGGSYMVVIRAIRLLRIFKILKLNRYMKEARFLGDALYASRRKIVVFMGAVVTLVMITGTLMYVIEGGENGFTSIPRSIYWAVVTVTTVGYGDISPHTITGQFFATLLMLLGYAIIAVPTGIVTSELNKVEKTQKNSLMCSSCDNKDHLPDSRHCRFCGSPLQVDFSG